MLSLLNIGSSYRVLGSCSIFDIILVHTKNVYEDFIDGIDEDCVDSVDSACRAVDSVQLMILNFKNVFLKLSFLNKIPK